MDDFFDSKGRIRRKTYIIRSLALAIINTLVVYGVLESSPEMLVLGFVVVFVTVSLTLVQFAKRLHDIGLSGYYWLIALIPIANFIFGLYVVFKDGDPYTNKYGPSPKYQASQNVKQESAPSVSRNEDSPPVKVKFRQGFEAVKIDKPNLPKPNNTHMPTDRLPNVDPIDEDQLFTIAEQNIKENLKAVTFPCYVELLHNHQKLMYCIGEIADPNTSSGLSKYKLIAPDSALARLMSDKPVGSKIEVGEHDIYIDKVFRKKYT
jgi:uncharacterized membrane protein YhaH (DUF805 family)